MFVTLRKYIRSIFKIILIINILCAVAVIISRYGFQEAYDLESDLRPAWSPHDPVACLYSKNEDMLIPLESDLMFPYGSIFFIMSSCHRCLNSREACAIESAARANPDRQVNILFAAPISADNLTNSALTKLLAIPNVEAMRIYLERYAEGTPLQIKFKKVPLTRKDLNMDIADVLKFLTIYKYSGIYVALDVIVTRPFQDLKDNWVVKETPASMSSDIFSFSEKTNGRLIADIALNTLVSDLYIPQKMDKWSFDSFEVMEKVILLWCGSESILNIVNNMCKDLVVLEPEQFYPISFYNRYEYFTPEHFNKRNDQEIYGYHTWSRSTQKVMILNGSLYAQLARNYCPSTYSFYGNRFGS